MSLHLVMTVSLQLKTATLNCVYLPLTLFAIARLHYCLFDFIVAQTFEYGFYIIDIVFHCVLLRTLNPSDLIFTYTLPPITF
jgi:hypothetical protein